MTQLLASGGVVRVPDAVLNKVSVMYAPILAREGLLEEAVFAVRHVVDENMFVLWAFFKCILIL